MEEEAKQKRLTNAEEVTELKDTVGRLFGVVRQISEDKADRRFICNLEDRMNEVEDRLTFQGSLIFCFVFVWAILELVTMFG